MVASSDLGRLSSFCSYTVHAGKFRDSSPSTSRPLPSKPNGVYYSTAALSFFAIWSLILPASLNNPQNNLLMFVLLSSFALFLNFSFFSSFSSTIVLLYSDLFLYFPCTLIPRFILYIFHLLSSLLLLHFRIQTYGSVSHSFVQLLGSQS